MSPFLFVSIAFRSLPEWMQLETKEIARAWRENKYYREMGA